MMTGRLVVLALLLVGLAGLWAVGALRSRRYQRRSAADLLRSLASTDRALVLTFSTPDCVPCRTIQKPALDELLRRYPGRVEIREIDAMLSPELARRFGILTVPSTVVVGPEGSVVAINHGVAGWERLATQLRLNGTGASGSR